MKQLYKWQKTSASTMDTFPNSSPTNMNISAPISVLVIDNYDSFVYNLVHYLEDFGCHVEVRRNDQLQLKEVEQFSHILLSPGPGIPQEAGLLKEIIARYAPTKDILGVCLGQQAIAEVFGGKLRNLEKVYHGIATPIRLNVDNESLFHQLQEPLIVGRYHSWVVDAPLPDCLEATSYDQAGEIMSLRHRRFKVKGVQFHPESVLTPQGKQILWNWLFTRDQNSETTAQAPENEEKTPHL